MALLNCACFVGDWRVYVTVHVFDAQQQQQVYTFAEFLTSKSFNVTGRFQCSVRHVRPSPNQSKQTPQQLALC